MPVEIAMVIGGVGSWRASSAGRMLLLVPALADGALVSADLGYRGSLQCVIVSLRVDAKDAEPIQRRLAFWAAREGGWARALSDMAPDETSRYRDQLGRCDMSLTSIAPDAWATAVRRVLVAAGCPVGPARSEAPVLSLQAGGPAWHGISYDRQRRVLRIPSPLAPVIGDRLVLQLDVVGARPLRVNAHVVDVNVVGRPGRPAGFDLAIDPEAGDAQLVLAEQCPPLEVVFDARIAPRYPVVARARVLSPAPDESSADAQESDAHIENLSYGGALLRTAKRYDVGAMLKLRVRVPNGSEIALPATVVRTDPFGVAVKFELDRGAEAALSPIIAGIAGRPRRVLIVDDDALALRMLSDAFQERGFDVVTASSGTAGLQTLADELLTIDLLVTDVHMPGLSGEELVETIRRLGGEADLPIVVVGASIGDDAGARLRAAGANQIVPKSAGPESIIERAMEVLRAHAHGVKPNGAASVPLHAVRGAAADPVVTLMRYG